jgi:hypothetical protein
VRRACSSITVRLGSLLLLLLPLLLLLLLLAGPPSLSLLSPPLPAPDCLMLAAVEETRGHTM